MPASAQPARRPGQPHSQAVPFTEQVG